MSESDLIDMLEAKVRLLEDNDEIRLRAGDLRRVLEWAREC